MSSTSSWTFVPISINDYVQKHLAGNPGVDRADLVRRLESALAAALAGAKCMCGRPIWALGSAEAGQSCFTCITGEADPSGDYEIAEALDGQLALGRARSNGGKQEVAPGRNTARKGMRGVPNGTSGQAANHERRGRK